VLLDSPVPVERLPGFENGEASVQDAAAQLAAVLLDVPTGAHVLDACAAPGGKAAHLLERTPDLTLVALDADPQRLDRVRANFARLGLTGAIVCGDAAAPRTWWDGTAFDRILLDAPCSATGVIRRHPDIRLHRTPEDIERLAAGQARLLDALWPLLAPGGKLLYVTCSILPEENHRQIARFLAREPAARAVPLRHPALAQARTDAHGGVQILPGGERDGFYYAALARET
jgi:16S rRNA (cytosine967-C5)-methyltransferase